MVEVWNTTVSINSTSVQRPYNVCREPVSGLEEEGNEIGRHDSCPEKVMILGLPK